MVTQENCLVFNSIKYAICDPQIIFYGDLYMADGIKPDPADVQSIANIPVPMDIQQFQSLLGMINFMHPFVTYVTSYNTFQETPARNRNTFQQPFRYSDHVKNMGECIPQRLWHLPPTRGETHCA